MNIIEVEIDKIIPYDNNPRKNDEAVDNGVTLCHECHKETDNYGWKARWNND